MGSRLFIGNIYVDKMNMKPHKGWAVHVEVCIWTASLISSTFECEQVPKLMTVMYWSKFLTSTSFQNLGPDIIRILIK